MQRGFESATRSRLAIGAVVALLAAAPAPTARAAETATVSVRVEVVSTCTISDVELDFGTYVAGQSSPLDATATLEVSECPVGSVRIEFDGGGSGNVRTRRMSDGGGNTLEYQIYADPTRRRIVGEGRSGQTLALDSDGNGSLVLYGRVKGGQVVPEGTYTDTVHVTMTF